MLVAAYKEFYKQLRKNGELPDLTAGYEIDPQTGDYYSDFYSQRKVLGNPSSNLKPYIEPEAVNFAVDFFTEDFRTLADRNASFGEKLEAGFFIIFRPAKAVKKVAKASDEVSDARKNVSKGTDNATNQVTKRSDPDTYYTYDELRALTKESGLTGRNVGFESHHLLSKQFASKFGVSQGDIISAPLTPMNHRGSGGEKILGAGMNINNAIQKELKNIVGTKTERAAVKNATPEQIWQAHRNVYEKMGNNDWAKAIYDAHVKHLGIPYK